MTDSFSNHAPLIPMSEMFTSNAATNTTTAATAGPADAAAATSNTEQQQQGLRKGSRAYSLELIDNEIENLSSIQSKNNEEIKKRLTDIQSLRENNLVVAGALGGLKKLKEKL